MSRCYDSWKASETRSKETLRGTTPLGDAKLALVLAAAPQIAEAASSAAAPLSVGQILRTVRASELASNGYWPSRAQQRVLRHLSECRTAVYGGHVDACERCGYERPAYNSCRDRHCPSCEGHKARAWLQARQKELLPVPYFHVVFTMPAELSAFASGNKKVVYEALFAAASEALREVASKRLRAEIGVLAVLHTWTQTMLHHPHVHCIVPGGGLSKDGARWIRSSPKFFLPVRVLGRVYRAKFLAKLKAAYANNRLRFEGAASKLSSKTAFAGWLGALREKQWVVYAKAPFGSPEQVLKYVARYTHKVAIGNGRLVRVEGGQVTFRYRDRKLGNVHREMTLSAVEFARRFLLHVLPKGMRRLRHYGFLGNACRAKKLELCRQLIPAQHASEQGPTDAERTSPAVVDLEQDDLCPSCKLAKLQRWVIKSQRRHFRARTPEDTS